jgi:hypothetical protein
MTIIIIDTEHNAEKKKLESKKKKKRSLNTGNWCVLWRVPPHEAFPLQ